MNKKGIFFGGNDFSGLFTWILIIIIVLGIFMSGIFFGKKLGREEMINELPIDRVLIENFSFTQNDTYADISFDKLEVILKS